MRNTFGMRMLLHHGKLFDLMSIIFFFEKNVNDGDYDESLIVYSSGGLKDVVESLLGRR